MPAEPRKPLIVISYAHADEPETPAEGEVKWLSFVTGYLGPAIKHGAVDLWLDRHLPGGADWEPEIERKLRACDVFILLISRHSLSSDYVVDKEIPIIRERQAKGEAVHFYPLILTPTPKAGLKLVRDKNLRPRDGRPLSDFESVERYRQMSDIADEIAEIAVEAAIETLDSGLSPPGLHATGATSRREGRALSNIRFQDFVPRYFVGREDALKAIDGILRSHRVRATTVVLQGLPGVGKTILAVAYAERHERDYKAIWLIRAQSSDTLRGDLVSLGVKLNWVAADKKEKPAVDDVVYALSQATEPLLLIYDNARDAEDLTKYLPGGAVHVIVTSNARFWSKYPCIEIGVWPPEVGADFLLVHTGRKSDRADAEALSRTLGGLPLAHEQAAAYCGNTGASLATYRKHFERAPAQLLDDGEYVSSEYNKGRTVAKAFTLAIDKAGKEHLAAEPLIAYAALLAPEPKPIPLFLFSEAREKFDKPFASRLAGDGLDKAIGALRAFALVEREEIPDEREPSEGTDAIRLHRLVRIAASARRQGVAAEEARRVLIEAMAEVYARLVSHDPKSWRWARRLDALARDLVAGQEQLPKGAEKAASYILASLGSYRRDALLDFEGAQEHFKQALDIRVRTLGDADPLTLASYIDFAYVHKDKQNFDIAQNILEKALNNCQQARGGEDRETTNIMTNLAILFKDKGDLTKARGLFEQVLEICKKTLGPEHPDTATCLTNLAFAVKDQGKLPEAGELFDKALKIRRGALGRQHPDTATSLTNLAWVYKDQREFGEARKLFEEALEIRTTKLGAEDSDTATSLDNLAFLLQGMGELERARRLYENALTIREKLYGPDNPKTVTSRNSLNYVVQALSDADRRPPASSDAYQSWRRQVATAANALWETLQHGRDTLVDNVEWRRAVEQIQDQVRPIIDLLREQQGPKG